MSRVNSIRSIANLKSNHHKEQEPFANIERLMKIFKQEIGSGWEKIFAETVRINYTN